MTTIDPEQERRRLAEFYAGQTDGELENVAAQGHNLTDVAREALRAELSNRGLYIGQLDNIAAPEDDDLAFRKLVTVRTFCSLTEAEIAKSLLDAAGVESFLFDENVGRIYLANIVGGIRLRVDAENAEKANQALEEASTNDEAEASESSDDSPA